MKKLPILLSLVATVASAHPGHGNPLVHVHGVDVGILPVLALGLAAGAVLLFRRAAAKKSR